MAIILEQTLLHFLPWKRMFLQSPISSQNEKKWLESA